MEKEICSMAECGNEANSDDSLCEECRLYCDEASKDARATYRQPYSRAEIEDAYSDPTERAKRADLY